MLLNLALAGRIADAKQIAAGLNDLWARAWLEQDIAPLRVAAQAKANPSTPASLAPLLTLKDVAVGGSIILSAYQPDVQRARQAGTRLGRRAALPPRCVEWIVAAEKTYAANHPVRQSATFAAVLQKWSEIADSVPTPFLTLAHIELLTSI